MFNPRGIALTIPFPRAKRILRSTLICSGQSRVERSRSRWVRRLVVTPTPYTVMRENRMKIGLLGYGFMGAAHLAAMRKMEGVTVAGVATRTKPSADAAPRGNLKLESGALPDYVSWVPDWRTLVDDPTIDAVDICLPTQMHREVILAAFSKGKHVLCEKPMALTPAECDEVVEAAERAGRTFMVAQVLRFMYPYRYALDFVRERGRGTVTAATLTRSTGYPRWGGWLAQSEQSGGAILDLLCHDIDIALAIFGQPVSVSAVSDGEIDTMSATLRFEDALDVKVIGGWRAPEVEFSQSFEIVTGSITLRFRDEKVTILRDEMEEPAAIPQGDPYHDEISYFVECCRTGAAPEQCPPQDSARAVKLATLLRESRESNGKELAWQP